MRGFLIVKWTASRGVRGLQVEEFSLMTVTLSAFVVKLLNELFEPLPGARLGAGAAQTKMPTAASDARKTLMPGMIPDSSSV